jgi:HSP20 family protein
MYGLQKYNRDEFLTPFASLFDDLFTSHFPALSTELGNDFFSKGSYPRVDVIEKPDKLILNAEITGLAKEDVAVELEGDTLTIKGSKRQNGEKTGERYVLHEIKRSSFQRSFVLGDNINKKEVKADFKDGLLTIELPRLKVEEPKAEKVKLL